MPSNVVARSERIRGTEVRGLHQQEPEERPRKGSPAPQPEAMTAPPSTSPSKRASKSAPHIRLAADIGGTFTDVAALDEKRGCLLLGKAISTPSQMIEGISQGLEKAGTDFADAFIFLHGSTVAINTMLERTGARTALLITEGFRDSYEIGRINRPDAYNLFFRKHIPLIPRSMCFEIRERLWAGGEILTPLDESCVHAVCDRLEEEGVEAVAILLLHSYENPAHEARVKEIVRQRLPDAFVTASHELSREYREFERCSTTAANAYVGPRVREYIRGIDRCLERADFRGSFLLVQSSGGLYESEQAKVNCIRMLESGPAAGVIGARALCRELGLDDAIAFDMGGTSAKAGVIYQNEALTRSTVLVGGYNEGLPVQIPMIDIFEVGTGGGSIASVEAGGALRVGPQSAGAEPGPACYGRGGTRPTVTDANLLLGRIGADRFLGGEMRLDEKAAQAAVEKHVAGPLGLSVTHAADGILGIAVTAMSYAVKGVSTERGLDAAAFTLIAYGGAGPLHASAIAREIGIGRIIIPRAPGHFCAFGMLFSDLRYDFVRTWFRPLAEVSFEEAERIYESLIARGSAAVESSGARTSEVVVERAADMRYVGQEHAVTITLPASFFRRRDRDAIKERFDQVHRQRYGTSAPAEPVEMVSLRATVTGVMRKPKLERIGKGSRAPRAAARRGSRSVYFAEAGKAVKTPAFARVELAAGNRIAGPALVEEHASTTVLLPGDRLVVDDFGNLVIEVSSRRPA